MIYALDDLVPELPDTPVFIAPSADVIGEVRLASDVSIWFGAVLRGDVALLEVGEGSNIQDNAVLHADPGRPVKIGSRVTVGHAAMLHGCEIGDESLIGMKAVVLTGARIGRRCLIGAHSLVPEGMEIPDGSLVMGAPAKVVRTLGEAMQEKLRMSADAYADKAQRYLKGLKPIKLDEQ